MGILKTLEELAKASAKPAEEVLENPARRSFFKAETVKPLEKVEAPGGFDAPASRTELPPFDEAGLADFVKNVGAPSEPSLVDRVVNTPITRRSLLKQIAAQAVTPDIDVGKLLKSADDGVALRSLSPPTTPYPYDNIFLPDIPEADMGEQILTQIALKGLKPDMAFSLMSPAVLPAGLSHAQKITLINRLARESHFGDVEDAINEAVNNVQWIDKDGAVLGTYADDNQWMLGPPSANSYKITGALDQFGRNLEDTSIYSDPLNFEEFGDDDAYSVLSMHFPNIAEADNIAANAVHSTGEESVHMLSEGSNEILDLLRSGKYDSIRAYDNSLTPEHLEGLSDIIKQTRNLQDISQHPSLNVVSGNAPLSRDFISSTFEDAEEAYGLGHPATWFHPEVLYGTHSPVESYEDAMRLGEIIESAGLPRNSDSAWQLKAMESALRDPDSPSYHANRWNFDSLDTIAKRLSRGTLDPDIPDNFHDLRDYQERKKDLNLLRENSMHQPFRRGGVV